MTVQESLLPCPFCGCVPKLEGNGSIRWIKCPKESECGSSGMAMGIAADDLDRGIAAWNRRAKPVARTPLSEVSEQATMFRWLRDHYHGFEHYRSDFAKKQNLFENDIRKQIGITQEKQG